MKIEALVSYPKARFDQKTAAHLVLGLTAPAQDGAEARPPLCIIPVIDVSGSMGGPKLDYAKRSAMKLIDHLKVGDYCGLIAFDTRVHIPVKPQKVTEDVKAQLRSEVARLQSGSATNFAGGLKAALEGIAQLDLPQAISPRVIMLTDGEANEGLVTKPEALVKFLAKELETSRATVSAFGYGQDVSQEFLLAFAKEGKGNYAFIQNPDDALAAFGKELGGLLSTVATNVVIQLDPVGANDIVSVVSDVDAEQEKIGGNVTIKLPDVYAEEVRNLVLAVQLADQKSPGPRAVNVFNVTVSYDTLIGGQVERKTVEAKAKVQFVKAGEEDTKIDPKLDTVIALAEVVRAQIEAEAQAKAGNFEAARQVMTNVAKTVGTRGVRRARSMADNIGARFSDKESYASGQGYLRSMQVGVTRGMGGSSYSADAVAELSEVGTVLTNAVQAGVAASFTEATPNVVTPSQTVEPFTVKPLRGFLHVPVTAQPFPGIEPDPVPPSPVDPTVLVAEVKPGEKMVARKPIRQTRRKSW